MKQECEQRYTGNLMRIAVVAGAIAVGLAGCDGKPAPKSAISKAPNDAVAIPNPAESPPPAPTSSAVSGDTTLAARVKSALTEEPALKQSLAVDVKAADGVVTLVGTASSAEKSHQAALVALNVDGVRSVKNDLVVLAGS